jgi:class 3 adenylate cyclase
MPLDGHLDSMPVILVREPGRTPLAIILHETLVVGRDSPGLLIDDPQASRSHLTLTPVDGEVLVTDMGSTNGTFLDGAPLDTPTRLLAGSLVRVGATTIELLPATRRLLPVGDPASQTSIRKLADEIEGETISRPLEVDTEATLTLVFTDIESSTRLSTSMGDSRWFELLSEHNSIIREHVARYDGTEIKAQGDGFMLAFGSVRRAIRAMVETQRQITHQFAGSESELKIRVGAHTGEAIADDSGDLYGYHVVLAARIADQAVGGEILVSEILKQIGDARGEFEFGEPRRVELKGLSGRYNLYPVAWAAG